MENNCDYRPIKKRQVTIFIANTNEELNKKSSGGLIVNFGRGTGIDDINSVETRISRQRDGIIVDMTEESFEGQEFITKPKIGDKISFGGYSGGIYENDRGDYYRVMEDKYIEHLIK